MVAAKVLVRPIREVALRPKTLTFRLRITTTTQSRFASNDQKVSQVPAGAKGPNEDQLPHVSEEQAAMDKSMGNTPPDISQGTPVQEMLQRDKDAQKSAPKVIKEDIQNQKRSYSTSARRLLETVPSMSDSDLSLAFDHFDRMRPREGVPMGENSPINKDGMIMGNIYSDAGPGHKFRLPDISEVSRLDNLRKRYDPVVDQLTKSIMRDGKLSAAQKHMDEILNFLRTAPAPQANPAFPQRRLLLSDMGTSAPNATAQSHINAPMARSNLSLPTNTTSASTSPEGVSISDAHLPRAALPLHPIEYLTTVIDSVAPIIKIRQQRGIAGGGASLPIPKPLGVRQRRRQAIQWILGAADNRREIKLSERIAKELIKIADGTSAVWERRAMVHRLGVSARSNVRASLMRKRR